MTSRSVPVQLDRLRHLKFSFNALADMQDVDPLIFTKSESSLPVLRLYLWAGLKHEDRSLQQYPAGVMKVGDILENYIENGGDLMELNRCLKDAIGGSVFLTNRENKNDEADPSVPHEVDTSKNSDGSGSRPSSQ